MITHDQILPTTWHMQRNGRVKKPVLNAAIKRKERGVILVRVGGTLAEIEGENRESLAGVIALVFPAREAQKLQQLPAVFGAIAMVSQDGIAEAEFFDIGRRVVESPAKRRKTP